MITRKRFLSAGLVATLLSIAGLAKASLPAVKLIPVGKWAVEEELYRDDRLIAGSRTLNLSEADARELIHRLMTAELPPDFTSRTLRLVFPIQNATRTCHRTS